MGIWTDDKQNSVADLSAPRAKAVCCKSTKTFLNMRPKIRLLKNTATNTKIGQSQTSTNESLDTEQCYTDNKDN